MKGDVTLLNLIMQQQQIPLPESLFVLVIQCVIELSGFPLSLAANIFPVTASQQVEANSAYQSLLYTMAGLKAHSSLTAVCGKLINIWTFIAQLRSLRSNLQQILVTDMKQIAQAIHELYATNENIPSGEVTENNESRNKQEAERVSSASYQACERIFACYETILPQVVWLQQSWQRCQHIQIEEVNEQDSETTPSKSWSMAIVDILHHEKFVSIIASILSIRKMVIELTTMMDWIAHPRSHELHHVSASFTKILSHLFELADFEKYVTVLCEKNASTIQYLWVEFGLDQTEESAQGSAIQFAMDMQLLRDGDQAKHHLAQWWCRCYFMQSMRKFVRVARSLFDAEEEQVGGMEDQRELYLMTMMIMNELVGQDCIHRMITQMTSLYFTTWLIKSSSEMIETCFPKNEAVSYSHSRSKFALLCQLRLLADALLSKEGESLSLQFISQLNTVLGRECEDGIKVASELILSTTAYSSMHPDQFVDALLQQPVSCFLSPQQLHSSITVLHTLGHNKQLSSNESHRQALLQLADRFLSRAYHVLQILHGKFMNSMHTPTSMGLQFISTEEVETLEFYLSADKISLSLSLHIQQAVSKFIINLLEMISHEVDVDDHLMVVLVSLYLQINQFTQLSDISTGDQHTLVGYSLCPVILTTISKCLQSVNVSSMLAFEADQHHKSSPFSLLLFLLPHTSHRDACVNLLHELTPDRGLLIDDVLISEFSHVYQTNSAFSSFVAHLQKAEFSKRKLHEVDQNLSTKWKQYLEFCETSAASWKGHALFTHWSYQQDGTELRPVLSVQESIKQCWLAAGNRPSLGNSLTTLTTKVMALNSASYFGIVPITLLQSISILYFKSIGNPKESINGGKIGLERYISVLVQNVEALSQGSLFTTYHFVQHGLLHTMLSLTAHAEISVSLLSLQSCITIYKRLEQCRIALLHTKDEDAVQVSQVRVNIQKVLNYVAMQLIDLLPSLAFKHQEATSYLQQTIFSIQLLPKHVFWNPFVSGFMHVGQGFTVEFIAVKLWIACEESFQYLYELLDVKKQTSMFATVFDQMPFDDLDIENMILEAQGQFAVAINALKAVLELVMWAYETKHITLSIMSKAMRTTLTDPKKVIIRFQRMYTMWTISFATQISEELKANGMDDSTRKDLFSSTNLQELYDARHALISTCLKWLVELTGRYSKFHSAREEKCINSIHVPAIAAEQWRDMSRLIDLRHPWNKTEGEQENNNQSEKLCMEVFSKSQCCQREVRQCLDRKLSCNLHHQDLLNLLHQDIKSQYFKSWNGIDSNVKSANFIMRELLQTRISLKPLSTSETKEDQDEKEIEVLEEFHKYKRQRVAKNILPEDVFEAFNKTLFPVVETRPLPQAEMMQPRPPPPPSADLSSFLASVEMSTEHQNIGESFSSGMDGDMGPNEGQEEEDYRPAVRLQGVPRANKNNANLGKYFQNSNTSFASKKYDDDARRPQQDRGLQGQQTNNNSGNNFSNQSQGRPDFRQRQNPPDRQQNYNNNNSNNNTNNNNFNDDNRQNNNAQGRNNNFDNNRGGNFQDRPRPNNRFDGGRKDFSQERGGDHVYQPPSGANAPPPRPSLPNMPPNFMPPPPPPPMMANLPPGFVPPPRPPAFGQLPPPPFPPQFPPK